MHIYMHIEINILSREGTIFIYTYTKFLRRIKKYNAHMGRYSFMHRHKVPSLLALLKEILKPQKEKIRVKKVRTFGVEAISR